MDLLKGEFLLDNKECENYKKISLTQSKKYWMLLLIAVAFPETFEKLSRAVKQSGEEEISKP